MTSRYLQRTLPPTAAPIPMKNLFRGAAGLIWGRSFLQKREKELREHFGVKHLFLVSSGKAALTLILQALKRLSSRQEVLIPAYTCFSVPAAVEKAGLRLSLCDIDIRTLDFDFQALEASLTEKTLCVVPTDLFGLPSNLERVRALCNKRGIFVIEDAAQAMGGGDGGKKLGARGDVGFFSLGRGKNISCGSGGIILTDSDEIAGAIRPIYSKVGQGSLWTSMRQWINTWVTSLFLHPPLYGIPAGLPFLGLGETKYLPGFSLSRMGGVEAALLSNWEMRLPSLNGRRRAVSEEFINSLDIEREWIPSRAEKDFFYLRLPIILPTQEEKEKLCRCAKEQGLGISPMYPSAVHQIAELKRHFEEKVFPGAEMAAARLVTLPVHPMVSKKDVEAITHAVRASGRSSSGNAPFFNQVELCR